MPLPGGGSTPAGDWVYVGAGTVPNNATDYAADALFSVEITAADASLVGTYWAFTSITPHVLSAGDYWIAVVYGDDNTAYISTSPVTTQSGITLLGGATSTESTVVNATADETFGPNFEDTGNTITNTGLIDDLGTLNLTSDQVNNIGGLIDEGAGAVMTLSGAAILGGTINGTTAGAINVTATSTIAGAILNNGEVTVGVATVGAGAIDVGSLLTNASFESPGSGVPTGWIGGGSPGVAILCSNDHAI